METTNKQEVKIEYPYVVAIKFKNGNKAYTFGTLDQTLEYGDDVVVETARGLELGKMISPVRPIEECTVNTALKPIVRKATFEDLKQFDDNLEQAEKALKTCVDLVTELGLDMHLISAEYTLDRTKILFVYVADDRVDFRELLKRLASALHCRIELRQIGARDKAKVVGGLGMCGMETCCSRFMNDFDVVSINMAKNQLLALNIQKLSGQCGKLMCCLRFEDEAYKELRKGLPKLNSRCEYEGNIYRITAMNVISKTAKLESKTNVEYISLAELKTKTKPVKVEQRKKKVSK